MHFIVYPWRAFSRIRQCCTSHCFGSKCECVAYTLSGIWFVHWSIFLTALALVRLLGLPEPINYSDLGIIRLVVYHLLGLALLLLWYGSPLFPVQSPFGFTQGFFFFFLLLMVPVLDRTIAMLLSRIKCMARCVYILVHFANFCH